MATPELAAEPEKAPAPEAKAEPAEADETPEAFRARAAKMFAAAVAAAPPHPTVSPRSNGWR
jgi:hypothetical protein